MNLAGRDHETLPGLERHRRFVALLDREGPFEDVADLFARVRVAARGRAGLKLGDRLDHFPARRGQVRLLDDGALEGGLLRRDDGAQHERRRNHGRCSHGCLLNLLM